MHKKIVALMLIVAMLASPAAVFAFGLGEIKINSALNEPMDAEIELVGFNSAQIDEVQIELASQDMFERVGVPRPYILTRLKFTPTLHRGKPVIKVTSRDAIREPFLTFLIDVRWAKGKLLREYTLLLDPPVFGDEAKASIQSPGTPSQSPSPAPQEMPAESASAPAPRTPAPSVRPTEATVPSAETKPVSLKKTNRQPATRAVNKGDTLWSIAEPFARENGVSVNQMMLAIQSANPGSFTANNINNLKSGTVLRIPTENLSGLSAREALAEVRRQWQVWKQGAVPQATAVNVDAGDINVSDGAPQAVAPQPDTDTEASSKLSILGEGDAASGLSGDDANATLSQLRQQVSLLKETAESKDQENSELQDRIQSLESMIKKQEDIISLQNAQLAQLQNSLAATDEIVAENSTADNTEDAVNESVDQDKQIVADTSDSEEASDSETVSSQLADASGQVIKPATVAPLPDFSGPIPDEFLESDQTTGQQQPADESLVAQADVASNVEQAAGESVSVEESQPGVITNIAAMLQEQSRTLLYAGGGILVLILGWIGIKRRQADKQAAEIEASGLPAFAEEPMAGEAMDDTVVASPDSIDEALDELETIDENAEEFGQQADTDTASHSDDMLAEADVYISYGLYQQAEELLKEGLAKDPDNAKYQFKLAEIYHGDKKTDDFVNYVESIAPQFDKNSPEWSRIISMGAALAPAHKLFAGEQSNDYSADSQENVTEVIHQNELDSPADDIEDFEMASEDLEDFDASDIDDNSLDFTFDSEDDDALGSLEENSTQALEMDDIAISGQNDELDDELEESSTALLEADLDLGTSAEETLTFDDDTSESSDNEVDDATEVFLDFDQDALENDLNKQADHNSETEMLDESLLSSVDLDDDVSDHGHDNNSESASTNIRIDNDLDEMLDGDHSETAMFDSSLFDPDSPEAQAFASDEDNHAEKEDTVSLEQVQENLTAELETLSFDSDDIDAENMEEDSLPTLQTSEIGKPDLDLDELDGDLAASETGTFEQDMLSEDVTEQFDAGDVGDIDATMTDLGEFGDDYDLESPSVIEEVGTKLDLAKAFVDMGDEDAAKETLTEVIEQGDHTQIQEAKALLDKLS